MHKTKKPFVDFRAVRARITLEQVLVHYSVLDTYAAKYVPVVHRTPSPEELDIRRIARDLKLPTEEAIAIAAPAMAALIDGPCWLVPIPASNGSLSANLALASAIAELVSGARVKCAVGRAHAVESCCERRLRGLPGLTANQHAIIRTGGPMRLLPVYFVDNVITTGTTVAACRRALGWGTGLAFADASTPRNTHRWEFPQTTEPVSKNNPSGKRRGRGTRTIFPRMT